jgi:hypothetical protein
LEAWDEDTKGLTGKGRRRERRLGWGKGKNMEKKKPFKNMERYRVVG